MARVSAEQKLNFEKAVADYLTSNPSASTQSVGEALYDTWRSPGPEGNRPKADRATDWAKRKLKDLAKTGKVYQPKRGFWEASIGETTKPRTTILRKAKDRGNGKSENGNFTPINVFDMVDTVKDQVTDANDAVEVSNKFNDTFLDAVSQNSPFIRGLLRTAQRHGKLEIAEPMLHALIEELVMTTGKFDN